MPVHIPQRTLLEYQATAQRALAGSEADRERLALIAPTVVDHLCAAVMHEREERLRLQRHLTGTD